MIPILSTRKGKHREARELVKGLRSIFLAGGDRIQTQPFTLQPFTLQPSCLVTGLIQMCVYGRFDGLATIFVLGVVV